MSVAKRPLRVVLLGDGESPHLLKWARALAPRVELWIASSRGLAPALASLVAPGRTLSLGHATKFAGGNVALLKTLPRLARWLQLLDRSSQQAAADDEAAPPPIRNEPGWRAEAVTRAVRDARGIDLSSFATKTDLQVGLAAAASDLAATKAELLKSIAETKAEMAPLLEEMQRTMESGRMLRAPRQ